jgi:long-chain acyl-CoA synthetase
MLSSRNVTVTADAGVETFGYRENEQVLSYLPLCHVAEKIFTLYLPLATGATVHFGESIDTVAEDLREVSPTVFVGVPRIWEKMHSTVLVKVQDASRVKKALFNFFTERGQRIARKRHDGERGASWTVRCGGWATCWSSGRCRSAWACVAAGSRSRAPRPWLRSCCGGSTAWASPSVRATARPSAGARATPTRPVRPRSAPWGSRCPGVECRIDEDTGEVLVRGEQVFLGYLHNPEATAETIDEDGWLHTGDVGEMDDDGYLTITGRMKDIIITAGGKNLSPEQIENALKTSPYIKEAVAIGDRRKFVSALIQIDFDNVGNWASRRGITYTSFADLVLQARGRRADPGRDQRGEQGPGPRRERPRVPAAAQGAAPGRRRAHRHAEGAAQDVPRALRPPDRGDVLTCSSSCSSCSPAWRSGRSTP